MSDLSDLFDEDTVENISNIIESKMPLLNKVPAFKKKASYYFTLAYFLGKQHGNQIKKL